MHERSSFLPSPTLSRPDHRLLGHNPKMSGSATIRPEPARPGRPRLETYIGPKLSSRNPWQMWAGHNLLCSLYSISKAAIPAIGKTNTAKPREPRLSCPSCG
jgi:hypothetical protein